jgi:hypothetical protein
MRTDINELRTKIAQLYPKRDIGDLTEKVFQQRLAEQTVALYRAVIKRQMAEGETIECEHHSIWTHFRLMQSILREPAQQAISLFLTDKRLFRIQSTLMPDKPPTADKRDNTIIDQISLDRIRAVKKRYQIRTGEILLGAIFCALSYLFFDLLSITGPILFGFGVLGMLHGLILPTKWIEVQTVESVQTTDPFLIYALRKKSAKELVRRLKEKLRTACLK